MYAIEKFNIVHNFQNYKEYYRMVSQLAEKESTTGKIADSQHIEATKLNAYRMSRIYKHTNIKEELKREMESIENKWTWLIIAESWCGDGAQNIPLIAKLAELNSNITLKIILRDENPKIMNAYLTNGSQAIPKLICFDSETGEEIGMWGPRPSEIQQKVVQFKKENPTISHEELVKNIQLWYAKDNGEALQNDFLDLIKKWKAKCDLIIR